MDNDNLDSYPNRPLGIELAAAGTCHPVLWRLAEVFAVERLADLAHGAANRWILQGRVHLAAIARAAVGVSRTCNLKITTSIINSQWLDGEMLTASAGAAARSGAASDLAKHRGGLNRGQQYEADGECDDASRSVLLLIVVKTSGSVSGADMTVQWRVRQWEKRRSTPLSRLVEMRVLR